VLILFLYFIQVLLQTFCNTNIYGINVYRTTTTKKKQKKERKKGESSTAREGAELSVFLVVGRFFVLFQTFQGGRVQFRHFVQFGPENGVYLLLQESGSHCDLVLFDSTGVARSLGCHVVLATSGPVFVVLQIIRNVLSTIQIEIERIRKKKKKLLLLLLFL